MSEAEKEADLVRLLQSGPITALVLRNEEIDAMNRLYSRGQIIKEYIGLLGILGVPHIRLAS